MNTLDLKGFGVQELNAKEMEVIDGGIWMLIAGALIGAAFTQDLGSLASAFNEGYDRTRR
jgi:lactobin A/cerein 7B family class IIb bacteriocin